jgi:hypothetical protein
VTLLPPKAITFDWGDRSAVLVAMAELAASGGWINLQPESEEVDAPQATGLLGIFSGRGPRAPVCSWVPGETTRQGVEYVALGIQHGAGGKVQPLLAERGITVPEGWMVMQDNARRGLVVAVPPREARDVVLDWLLRAATALSLVPLTGSWHALVYHRS